MPRQPRDPNSAFEREYLAYYARAIASYRQRFDHAAALILSDAIDGVIHNAARRGTLADPAVHGELVRLVSRVLTDQGD